VEAGLALAAIIAVVLSGCTLLQRSPVADFDVSPVVIYAGESFKLDGSSSSGSASIVSYSWALSDGQTLAGKQVNATLSFPGSYTVTLTVEDSNGLVDQASRTLTVYARTGTVLLDEDFSDGDAALARWALDPTWASVADAQIDFIQGTPGYALYIHSSEARWHRRYHAIELPPLRVGQKVVFSCDIMTLRNQDFHTFVFAPARAELESVAGSLPYFLFTNEGDGSYVQVPSELGTDVGHPIAYKPDIYRWHTYTFMFDTESYDFLIDGVSWMTGPLQGPFSTTSKWIVVIGDESSTESCNAYFDNIRVTVEE
jgi:PKD repeat protein